MSCASWKSQSATGTWKDEKEGWSPFSFLNTRTTTKSFGEGLVRKRIQCEIDVMTKRSLPNDRLGRPRLLDDGRSFQKKRTFFCSPSNSGKLSIYRNFLRRD